MRTPSRPARCTLLLRAHAAGIQVHGARAAVAHVDIVLEGVVAAAQHRHRQPGIILRHDGRAGADQHAGPGRARRMVGRPLARTPEAITRVRPRTRVFARGGLDAALRDVRPWSGSTGAAARRRRARWRRCWRRPAGLSRPAAPRSSRRRRDCRCPAQPLAGLDQQRRQAQPGQPQRAGGARRPAAYNDGIVNLLHCVP